jgi:arylesterase/paraoxonase
VLFYDGTKMTRVADRLRMANGIALSPDGLVAYVSESSARRLRVFDRNVATGELTSRERIPLDATPDNLAVDADGSVWIGAHPRAIALFQNLNDGSSHAPTQVLKFTPGAERGRRVTEIYMDDGKTMSAGTVAAPRGNLFVLGSDTDHKLLLCTQGAANASQPAITGPEKEDSETET